MTNLMLITVFKLCNRCNVIDVQNGTTIEDSTVQAIELYGFHCN